MPESAPASNRSWRGLWRFVIIGLGSYLALTFGVIALVETAHLGEHLAYAIMITAVMIANFYANRRFVFPASRTGAPARQAAKFLPAALSFGVIEFALFSLFIGPLAIPYVIAIAVTSAVSYGAKYYVFSVWIFR
ncbi:MAG: GtrA family protein [Candidatus Synoicihabitans palmerolidicus]|nr:GtrA family protein [Candidatus Synoicihabitans palmerolidicus]